MRGFREGVAPAHRGRASSRNVSLTLFTMAEFRSLVLAPGRRCVGKNPDGSKRYVTFTADYCRDKADRGNRMLAKGINIPVCWEHRADGKPRKLSKDDWASERAKGTAGSAKRFEVDADNRVFAVHEIPDDSDAKRAEVVRFCSPEINAFTDGDGEDWGEVITHIALTPRPVQHEQPPIARLSLTGPIRLAI